MALVYKQLAFYMSQGHDSQATVTLFMIATYNQSGLDYKLYSFTSMHIIFMDLN